MDFKKLSEHKLEIGIALIVGGPLVLRLVFELLLLPFRINNTLTDIRKGLLAQNTKALDRHRRPSPSRSNKAGPQ